MRGGLAFHAKSTMAIVPGLGSFVALGTLVTDVPPEHGTAAPARQGCGSCTI